MKTLMMAAAAAFLSIGTAASAATLSVVGGNAVAFNTGNYGTCDPGEGPSKCYDPNGPAGGLTVGLTAFTAADPYPGLAIVGGPAKVRVSFIGFENGSPARSVSFGPGLQLSTATDAIGDFYEFSQTGPGALNFSFKSALGSQAGSGGFQNTNGGLAPSIAFYVVDSRTVYAFFDDGGAGTNRDFDDMVVKISIVPVPAAGLLLLGSLGGFAALRRRKAA